MLSLIMAHDLDYGIGKNGGLPWKSSFDLKRFKTLTLGKPMVMGRRTFESLPGILPGRVHIVMSSRPERDTEFVKWATSVSEVLELTRNKDAFVIGGAEIAKLFLPYYESISLTEMQNRFECDTFLDSDFMKEIGNMNWETSGSSLIEEDIRQIVTYSHGRIRS